MLGSVIIIAGLISICVLSKLLEKSSIPEKIVSIVFGHELRKTIYEYIVFRNPKGVTLSDLVNDLGVARQKVQYHLKILVDEGIIFRDDFNRLKPKIRVLLKSYAIPENTAFIFANLTFFTFFLSLLILFLLDPSIMMGYTIAIGALVF